MNPPEQHCFGKRAWMTRSAAKQSVRRLKRKGSNGMHVYVCPTCGYYHVGHRRKSYGDEERPE